MYLFIYIAFDIVLYWFLFYLFQVKINFTTKYLPNGSEGKSKVYKYLKILYINISYQFLKVHER